MSNSSENLYRLDGRVPLGKALPFGLQHVLAMFVSNITPIMILAAAVGLDSAVSAALIQNCMVIAGIGTLVQLFPVWRIGSRLPIVMGISFTFLSLAIGIAGTYGMGTLIGAVIVGGLVEGLLGLFVKYWIKLIPHVVSATVVTAIGFSLLPIGANSFAGGMGAPDFGSMNNWIVGTVTLLACLLCQVFAKGFLRSLSVLVGLIVGYVLACFMGMVNFDSLSGHSIIALPRLIPFTPEFNIGAILSVVAVYLVSATETIGDTSALCNSALSVRLYSNHIVQPERRSCSHIGCRKPLHYRRRCCGDDYRRRVPRYRCRPYHNPAGCARRLYYHDVRKHSVCRIRHDGTRRLLTAQHGHCQSVAQCRPWLHPSHRNVCHIPRNRAHRICRKLRGCSVPACRYTQSCIA